MNGFQLVASLVLGPACVWSLYMGVRHRNRRQVVLGLILAGTLLLVHRPDLATRVANLLGIGRGADLVSYISALGVLGCFFLILGIDRRMRIQITELNRAIALLQLSGGFTNQAAVSESSNSNRLPNQL